MKGKKEMSLQDIYILQETEQQKQQKQQKKRGKWPFTDCLLPFFLMAGIFLSVRQLAYGIICIEAALIAGVLTIQVRSVVMRKMKKPERVKNLFYITVVVSFAVLSQAVIYGLLDLTNRVLILWNQRFGTEFNRFQISNRAGIGALWLWIVATILLAMFLKAQMEKRALSGILCVVIISMMINFIFENHSMMLSSFCLLIGIFGLLNTYTTVGRRESARGYVLFLMLCILVGGMCLFGRNYKKLDSLESWKGDVVDSVEKFRYGSDSLPQGKFQKAAMLLEGDEKRLQVRMNKPDALYLRGYVGSDYAYTKWNTLSQAKYQDKNLGMLRWLEKRSFVPVSQYARYNLLTSREMGTAPSYASVTVKNVNAYRKYVYLPDTVFTWSDYGDKVAKDWQVQSNSFFGTSGYSFKMAKNSPMAEEATAAKWLENGTKKEQKQYRSAEAVYHSFVEENYMQIPKDVENHVERIFFKKGTGDNFEETTKKIRQVLRDEVNYSEKPEKVPAKQDLTTWFLETSKEGNAVSYATAAVLAYRTAGYPARYVEGYHLSEQEAAQWKTKKKKKSDTPLYLTTKNAHAWAEVYIAGMGWLPVEVVPGMYVETYTNQLVAGKSAYQVNSGKDNKGLNTDKSGAKEKSGESRKGKEKQQKKPVAASAIVAVIECILYACLLLYLMLELQRWCRIRRQNAKIEKMTSEELLDFYVMKTEEVFHDQKIEGDYTHPDELWVKVSQKFPEYEQEEYNRVVQMVQKVRFGCMELAPYEKRAMYKYYLHLVNLWYNQSSGWKKSVLRYRYLVQPDLEL